MPEDIEFRAADATRLQARAWDADKPRALVVIVHGLGEHSGRYSAVAEHLNGAGCSVFAPDHRGHGRSGGLRGHVDGFERYAADLDLAISEARERTDKNLPWFLYGHSMGALITLLWSLDRPASDVSGLIVSNPPLRLAVQAPVLKIWAGRLLSRVVPRLRLGNELDEALVSRDPEVVKSYETDPLNHDLISTRWFTSMEDAQQRLQEAGIAGIRPPQLWFVSGDDRICDPDGSRAFVAAAPRPDIHKREWSDRYHEPHNDLGREEVYEALTDWIEERLEGAP